MEASALAYPLNALLSSIRRDYPQWEEGTIVSHLRRSIPDYAHGIWRIAMPLNQGASALKPSYAQRFAALREQAIAEDAVDLGHVVTSIDVGQSLALIDSSFASWAGDLGTHVLANLTHQRPSTVGALDSMASLADLHGDMDGDNIARHLPPGQAAAAVVAYYAGDEAFLDGVTWRTRYHTFARDLGLLDESGTLTIEHTSAYQALRTRALAFIELNELIVDVRHPLQALREMVLTDQQARLEELLDEAAAQFLVLLDAGLTREKQAQ